MDAIKSLWVWVSSLIFVMIGFPVAVLLWLLSLLFDRRIGFLAAFALLATNFFMHQARYAELEGMLTFFITASIYFFFKKDPRKARYHQLKAIDLTDDEGQKQVYRNFLNTIDKVIAGEKQIPEVSRVQDLDKHNEGHHHD